MAVQFIRGKGGGSTRCSRVQSSPFDPAFLESKYEDDADFSFNLEVDWHFVI